MWAAFPSNDADNLLLLSERPCLMNYECDQPIYAGYLVETRHRLEHLFRAYYAFTPDDVRPLARQTPTRYLVVRRDDLAALEAGKPRLYLAPHNRWIRSWTKEHWKETSFWNTPEAPAPVYQDETYRVFDLEPFRGS
jgi:hypothetical protein